MRFWFGWSCAILYCCELALSCELLVVSEAFPLSTVISLFLTSAYLYSILLICLVFVSPGGSEGAGSVSHSQSRNSVGMVSVMTSEADDGGDEDD